MQRCLVSNIYLQTSTVNAKQRLCKSTRMADRLSELYQKIYMLSFTERISICWCLFICMAHSSKLEFRHVNMGLLKNYRCFTNLFAYECISKWHCSTQLPRVLYKNWWCVSVLSWQISTIINPSCPMCSCIHMRSLHINQFQFSINQSRRNRVISTWA